MSLTWQDGDCTLMDCPGGCGHAGRVERHGQRIAFRCFAQCSDNALGRVIERLAPDVLAEMQARDTPGVAAPTPAHHRVVLSAASAITPSSPIWAWRGRIPSGLVTLLAGREGLGKSSLMVEVGSRLTRGDLPGDLIGTPVDVVIASAEDSAATTMVPRFIAAGADRNRVHLLHVVDQLGGVDVLGALSLPDDLNSLIDAVVGVNAKLLVLDPLVSYLAREVNAHRDQDIRRVLAPLAAAAAEHDIAVVGVIHLNKGDTTDVLARVSGSVGFTAAARSVLAFARDPEDPEGEMGMRRVIAHAKCNVGPLAASMRARIEPRVVEGAAGQHLETSRMVLLGETDQTARDLLEQPGSSEERTARDEAADFLREELAAGPVATMALKQAADDAGLSWRTVERAKKTASAKAVKNSAGEWQWELNPATPVPSAPDGGLGGLPSLEPFKTANGSTKAAKTATAKGVGDAGGLLTEDELVERLVADFDAVEVS